MTIITAGIVSNVIRKNLMKMGAYVSISKTERLQERHTFMCVVLPISRI
jgi:hypothetical protein